MNLAFRRYHSSDLPSIKKIYVETINAVNAADYTPAQRSAWIAGFHERSKSTFERGISFIACNQGNIVGFGTLTPDGEISNMYIHKDFQRQGIGSQILKMLEQTAAEQGISTLFLYSSITSESFYRKHKYITAKHESYTRNGQAIHVIKMIKVSK